MSEHPDEIIDHLPEVCEQCGHSLEYERIRESVQSSLVVGADETGCRVNGKKHWFHVWQTPYGYLVNYK